LKAEADLADRGGAQPEQRCPGRSAVDKDPAVEATKDAFGVAPGEASDTMERSRSQIARVAP